MSNGNSGGWNRPVANQPTVKKGGAKAPSVLKGIVAGLVIVCALGGLCLWMFSGRDAAPKAKVEKERGRIKEVMPAKARTNAVEVAKPATPKERPPQRVGELRDGYVLLPSGDLHKVKGIITNDVESDSFVGRTLKTYADRMIGYLVMVEPGEGMLGSSEELYAGFDQEFLKSLKTPIEDSKDDTEEQKALKAAVRELRHELNVRMATGEDINKVMIDARNQLKELSLYRNDLEKQVMDAISSDFSKEDYKDLVDAANKMLEERGSKPLEMPTSLKHALYIKKLMADPKPEAAKAQKEEK